MSKRSLPNCSSDNCSTAKIPKIDEKRFQCPECSKNYSHKSTLQRHISSSHVGVRFSCFQCEKYYKSADTMKSHFLTSHTEKHCARCNETFDSDLIVGKEHVAKCSLVKPELQNQIGEGSLKIGIINPELNYELDPIVASNDIIDDEIEEIRKLKFQHWRGIRTSRQTDNILDHVYNFRYESTHGNYRNMLLDIYQQEKDSFRINASLGVFLRNRETNAFRYFYPSQNNYQLFDRPQVVASLDDLDKVIDSIESLDLETKFTRPDTKSELASIANVEFYVMPLTSFVAGCRNFSLPPLLSRQKINIHSMIWDKNRNPYRDNLCLFRCIAQCLYDSHETSLTEELFRKYCIKKRICADKKSFAGVPFTDLPIIENIFSVNIQLFHLTTDGAVNWKKAINRSFPILNIDVSIINEKYVHYSYIKNLRAYAKRYICIGCKRFFKKYKKLSHHVSEHCNNGKTRHIFPGGIYKNNPNLFERLAEEGINVDKNSQRCEFVAVFDFEAMLRPITEKEGELKDSTQLHFISHHQPVSYAIKTNVPTFDKCYFSLDEDPDELVKKFIDQLHKISDEQEKILSKQFEHAHNDLSNRIEEVKEHVNQLKSQEKCFKREKAYVSKLQRLKSDLDNYCKRLTVLGFNSKKYDLNLIKKHLYPQLVAQVRNGTRHESNNEQLNTLSWPSAIVQNSSTICLTTTKLQFLDISNYLAAGSSLESFLDTFCTSLRKAKFPYEYFSSFEKLNESCLPPIEAFHNSLKNEDISEEEYNLCQKYWRDLNMMKFADYLKFYNERDVEPFLEAVLDMANDYWIKFDIDIYRDVISLPGLTLRYLFKTVDTPFALFSEYEKRIYYELKDSLCGGLSVVMKRLAVKDQTFIRNNPKKPVKTIVGYDANALYLMAEGKAMPTGFHDFWELNNATNIFEKKTSSKRVSIEWIEYEEWGSGIKIQHLGNGKEKRVGLKQLPVDGFCEKTNTIYEFYGCYFHSHNCHLGLANKKQSNADAMKNIKMKEEYIRMHGFSLVTMWECCWKVQRNDYILLRKVTEPDFFRHFHQHYRVSYKDMHAAITGGSLFGFAKVDIHTPNDLKKKYADFPPIIKHAYISRDDIGPHMQNYAQENDLMRKPRKNLIGSYFGKEIILFTPMIKYLVEHGLVLEKIHFAVQYDCSSPFVWFRDLVTKNRLHGDGYAIFQDKNGQPRAEESAAAKSRQSTLTADTFKLLGNTGYGKSITNKEKHVNTFFCDYKKAVECNLDPLVKRIKHITPNCYEVQMYKKSIKMDLPIVIGLATYSWAKLRMLEFAYDCLLRYLDKADYEWIESDTDSAYLALSADNLEDLVKPELRAEFLEKASTWFVDPKIPYTKRQPGLFKEEFRGTAMASLSAKTYIACDVLSGKTKMSSKGLSHRTNKKEIDDYISVLMSKKDQAGNNIGFRLLNNSEIWTYIQKRFGLSYLYVKRKVNEDGITTEPLDL